MIAMPIDMPKGCAECPCYYDGWCSLRWVVLHDDTSLPEKYAYSKTERDPRCLLVERHKRPGTLSKEEIHDARYNIEWVIEYLEAAGEKHKQVYIEALEGIDKLLERLEGTNHEEKA